MTKTITEINEKIKEGKAVVFTAEEIIDFVKEKGITQATQEVDVVTTGTFSPMCSSSAYFNIGHTSPRIKLGGGRVYLNDVPAYTGMASTDPAQPEIGGISANRCAICTVNGLKNAVANPTPAARKEKHRPVIES